MPIELKEENGGKLASVCVSGKLTKHDYEHFAPEVEAMIKKHGKIDFLLNMHEFHGWDAGALWEDIKFDMHHFNQIGRIAMIGDSKWEKWMSAFCRPFTTAKVKYFEKDQLKEADAWIRSA